MLNIRAYTEAEIRQKLSIRGFESIAVDNAISYLYKYSYLNDYAICNKLFENYCKSNKYSLKTIIIKLKQRGIAANIINEVIRDYDLSLEVESALKVFKKRFKTANSLDIRRIAAYLTRKGYASSTISKIINDLD